MPIIIRYFLGIFALFIFFTNISQSNNQENCPEEINDYYSPYIITMNVSEFRRFSHCFYCIRYKETNFLCLLKNKIYEFFDKCNNKYDLSSNLTGNYYTLLIINHNETDVQITINVDYLIYFIGINKHIYFFHYSFIAEGANNIFVKKREINNIEIEAPKSLTCQIVKKSTELICFYILKPNLFVEIYNISNSFSTIYKNNYTFEFQDNNNITLKSSKTPDEKKILLCFEQKNNFAFYDYFFCDDKNLKDPIQLNGCETNNQLMEIYFLDLTAVNAENGFYFCCQNKDNLSEALIFMTDKDISEFQEPFHFSFSDVNWGKYFNLEFNKECNLTYYSEFKTNEIISTTYLITTQKLMKTTTPILTDAFSSSTTDFPEDKTISTYSQMPIESTLTPNISPNTSTNSYTIDDSLNSYKSKSSYDFLPFSTLVKTYISTSFNDFYDNSILISQITVFYNIKNLLLNITDILKDKEAGKTYKIKGEDYEIIIKPANSTREPNATYINFTECESLLRNHYNISESSYITLLQLELYNNYSKSLINQVEYELYDENFTKLNLNLCNNKNIQIIYAIKDNLGLDTEMINSLKNLGIDVFDINDNFFWDVCQPYSAESGNDLILEDRIKDLYQNFSLCEEGCTYDNLSLENMTVSCNCKIKENIATVVSEINLDQIKYETTSNFDIIKCYDIIFKFKLEFTNIGFWIFSILLLLHFPLIFHYFYTGVGPIYNFVIKEMVKYGYLTNDQLNNNRTKNHKEKTKKKENNPPQKKKKGNNKKVNNAFVIQNNIINKTFNKLTSSMRSKKEYKKKFKKKKSNKKININVNNFTEIDNSKNIINNNGKNLALIDWETKNPEDKKNKGKSEIIDFALITINLKNKKYNNDIFEKSYRVLNNYTFEEAIKYDKRDLCEIFFIYLNSKQAIFHAFFFKSPLELFSLRLCLLFFIFSCDLALNAFFYFNDNISKKYHYAKNLFLFTFSNNITVILLSTFTGFILLTLFIKLSNSTNAMREVFQNEEEKIKKQKNYKVSETRKIEIKNEIDKIFRNYKIKIIVLLTVELLFMIFFWYYVTIFCHVYKSTQTSWILDSFLSILSRFIIDALICLGLAKLYRIGVDSNIKCIYKFSMFLYGF